MRKAVFVILLAALLVACGGSAESGSGGSSLDAERVRQGDTLFHQTCFTCHGADGMGLPGLGKDLVTSQFVADNSDQQLLDYVKAGRPVDDPRNTTGVAMPPKGGFDFLTDDDILAIIAYVRSIHQ
jgi:disulfide bond formation protein DsbB